MAEHDPLRFATGLSAKLASRSRHVCLFLGAGAGRACGLPDISQLKDRVIERLTPEDKKNFEPQAQGRNLEQALSRLRRIAALLHGDQVLDGLTSARATALDTTVCQVIVKELNLNGANRDPMLRLAAWVARADYHQPVELFTVNYDLLIETALEELKVPYFDGFVGALNARFQTELVETTEEGRTPRLPSFFVRLWKLHGSVNWAWRNPQEIIRLGQPVSEGTAAAIYPSDTKYEESRRVPFVVLQDRFRRALFQSETLTLISGYSFSDDHLNEFIFDAATRRERSEFVAFCYSDIPNALANRAIRTPNIQAIGGREAILGGLRANWAAREGTPQELWANETFTLHDFSALTAYLARTAANGESSDDALRAIQTDTGNAAEGKVNG